MLQLAGTVKWEKYNADGAKKCGVLQMGSTIINEKQHFEICSTQFFYLVV
jgi:hypothetical protein